MTMNLRVDNTFVQDEGWYAAARRYEGFLRRQEGRRVFFLELGVGYNTPGIIKYPFWQWTEENPKALYACLNAGQALAPEAISGRSILLEEDIGAVLAQLLEAA